MSSPLESYWAAKIFRKSVKLGFHTLSALISMHSVYLKGKRRPICVINNHMSCHHQATTFQMASEPIGKETEPSLLDVSSPTKSWNLSSLVYPSSQLSHNVTQPEVRRKPPRATNPSLPVRPIHMFADTALLQPLLQRPPVHN